MKQTNFKHSVFFMIGIVVFAVGIVLGVRIGTDRAYTKIYKSKYDCNIFSNGQQHVFKDCILTKGEK